MKIIVDADSCPKGVKYMVTKLASKYGLELVMVIDDSHRLHGRFKVVKVSTNRDAVDLEIVRLTTKEDIVITHDYGLASMVVNKSFATVHPDGTIYTNHNLESLMFQRYLSRKIRREGGKSKGMKKRTKEEKMPLNKVLENLIENSIK